MSSKNFFGLTGDVTIDGGILNIGNAQLYANTDTSNVGIGTTNPGFPLDVRGDANVASLHAKYIYGDAGGLSNIVSSQWVGTYDANGDPIGPITFARSVGIANTTPITKTLQVGSNLYVEDSGSNVLHVTGNVYTSRLIGDKGLLTSISVSNTNPTGEFQLGVGSNLLVNVYSSNVLTVDGNVFAQKMTLGTVTVTPAYALSHVTAQGNISASTLLLTNATTAINATANIIVGGNVIAGSVVTDQLTFESNAFVDGIRVADIASNLVTYNGVTGELLDSGGLISNRLAVVSVQPPGVLSGAATTITGHGEYKVSASNVASDSASWNTFDGDAGVSWETPPSYIGVSNTYITAGTTQLSGTTVLGEWLAIELPYSAKLRHMKLTPKSTTSYPGTAKLYATNDSVTWTELKNWVDIVPTDTTPQNVVVDATTAYTKYGIVTTKVSGDSSNVALAEWQLYTESFTVDGGRVQMPRVEMTNAVISGNLLVNGSITTVVTENLSIKDPLFELGKDNVAGIPTDLGIIMTRPAGSSNVAIVFDESASSLNIGYTLGNASQSEISMESGTPLHLSVTGNVSVSSNLEVGTANLFVDTVNSKVSVGTNMEVGANLEVGTANLFVDTVNSKVGVGTNTPSASLHVVGNVYTSTDLTVTGSAQLEGGIALGSHIIPTTNAAFDVGSPDYKIRDIFVDNNSMWVGDAAKIAFSGGKMKFKRRKLNKTPKFVKELAIAHSIPGVTDEATAGAAAVTYLKAHFPSDGIGTLTDLKLQHWKAYTKSIDATKEISDIFVDNDEDYEAQSAADAWGEVESNIFSTHSVTVGATTDPRAVLDVNHTGAIIVPVGDTGERPSGVPGMIRYNSDTGAMETFTTASRGWGTNVSPPTITAISPTGITATGGYLEGFHHQKELFNPDKDSSDQFGWSVSISADGTRAIVGARYDDIPSQYTSDPGGAYIYTRVVSDDRSDCWKFEARLTHPTPYNSDHFGWSVSMSDDGNRVIVGTEYGDVDRRGTLSNGTTQNALSDAGSAHIFSRDAYGAWTHEKELRNPVLQASDYFGYSVAISGDGNRVIVGAYRDDVNGSDTGTAQIFQRDATTTPISWTHEKELTHAGVSGQTISSSDQFGWSVSISTDGSLAIVGARYTDSPEGNAGSAYVFKRNTTTNDWNIEQRLTNTGGYLGTESSDYFGYSVAISGDGTRVIVGAYGDNGIGTNLGDQGSAHIFRRDATTTPISWVYEKELQHTSSMQSVDSSDQFGWSVSISNDGNRVIAGARYTNLGGGNAGSAYVFDRTTGTNDWTLNTMLVHPTPASSDYFGYSVAISGDGTYTIVGAYADDNPTDSGSAQVFNFKSQLIDTSTQVFTATGTGITNGSIVQLVGVDETLYDVFNTTAPNAAGTEITFKMGSLGASGGYNRAQQPYKVRVTSTTGLNGSSADKIGLAPEWSTTSVNFTFNKSSSTSITLVARDGAYVSSSGSWAGTFSVVSANLPPGLTLNPSTGLLSGTVDAGYSTPETIVTFRVTDNVNLLFADRVFNIITESGLYNFTSHTFTSAGMKGRNGPTLTNLREFYGHHPDKWHYSSSYFNVEGSYNGIQKWTVPVTGSYEIEAAGASTEWARYSTTYYKRGGRGAIMTGTFTLTQGEIIKIVVGQIGEEGTHSQNSGGYLSGGGGGTFVIRTPYTNTASILVIAGGGGGSSAYGTVMHPGGDASTGTSGISGGFYSDGSHQGGGAPGGSGGAGGGASYGGGGGGFTGNGGTPSGTSSSNVARSFTNMAKGGQGARSWGGGDPWGGFGGGGGSGSLAAGGGGGYSGGGSGSWSSYQGGGGGGSYNSSSINTSSSIRTVDAQSGYVRITKL